MIIQLLKSGKIDVDQLRDDAECDFSFLMPILDTIAIRDRKTRVFSLKIYPEAAN